MSRQDILASVLQSVRGKLAESSAQVDEALAQAARKKQEHDRQAAEALAKLALPQVPPEPELTAQELADQEKADRYWGGRREPRFVVSEPEDDDEAPRDWLRAEPAVRHAEPEPEPDEDDRWGGSTRRFGYYEEED